GFQQMTRQNADQATPSGTHDDRAEEFLYWPFAGARLVLDTWLGLFANHRQPPAQPDTPLSSTTPHSIALELATLRLRDFSTKARGRPVVICAPYALHDALLTAFAPAHSIVEALQQGGVGRLFVTDWRSATPDMRYLSIDSYLADLNAAVDTIG